MLKDLVTRTRSYRRFDESHVIDRATLRELVDLARLVASASNLQPLKYILVCEPDTNVLVFETTAWAGYLPHWPGPAEGERPTGYIIILRDRRIKDNADIDVGIAAQTIMLGATERGLGGCMIGSLNHRDLRRALTLPDEYEIMLALALGKPAETVVIETVGEDGSVRYWRDADDVHHVPKRALDDIIYQRPS